MFFSFRDETEADHKAVREIVTAAFGREDEADLVEALRRSGEAEISLVAEDEGVVVGHVMFSPMTAPFRALGLAPVSVTPKRQMFGIGGALIRNGLDRARAAGWDAVFVLGDPEYYTRFGFDPKLAAGFASPYAGPNFMALALSGDLPQISGKVEYAQPFSSL